MQRVQSWGRLTSEPHHVVPIFARHDLSQRVSTHCPGIAFGNGRSYGDVCLNPGGVLWQMRGLDRFIAFDHDSGLLEVESGVTLAEILAIALPHGWFVPVTPGTQ